MICESCGKNTATVHWTEIRNNTVHKMHLCESCAAAKGLDINDPDHIPEMLMGMSAKKMEPKNNRTCPQCHMRMSDFKKTSRLGCQTCYEVFGNELKMLLESMHKANRHVGKTPSKCAEASCAPAALIVLRNALEAAIAAEHYEEAARLRDQIRQHMQERPQPKQPTAKTA